MLVSRRSPGKSRELLDDLFRRKYYKRVFELSLAQLKKEGSWVALRERLTGDTRKLSQEAVNQSLTNCLVSEIQSKSAARESLQRDHVLEKARSILHEKHGFLIDLPLKAWDSSPGDPRFVSDYKRRHFRVDAVGPREAESATLWSAHLGPMMREIATFRVFCEPDLHGIVTRVLSPDIVRSAVDEALPGIGFLDE